MPKKKTSNSVFEVLYILIKIKNSSDLIIGGGWWWLSHPGLKKKHAGQIRAFPLHLQGETSLFFDSTSIYIIPFTFQNVDAQYKQKPVSFHYTGPLLAIITMVYYPDITG